MSHRRRTEDRDALNAALVLVDSIEQWLVEAVDLGLRTAVASSSDVAWVERHLRQVDALGRFGIIVGGDHGAASARWPGWREMTPPSS